jgi:hypothetical protein
VISIPYLGAGIGCDIENTTDWGKSAIFMNLKEI